MRAMRKFHSFPAVGCAMALGVIFGACGDDSGNRGRDPDDAHCTVVAGDVLYDASSQRLTSTVTVTVADDAGNPLSGHRVTLDASRTVDTVDETEGLVTDAAGEAVFHVSADTFGLGGFTASLPDASLELTERALVNFVLGATAAYGEVALIEAGAEVSVDITLSDAAGGVGAVMVTLLSDRASDAIAPSGATTSAAGEAFFTLTASETGDVQPRLEVDGLQGTLPLETLGVHGPTVSGNVTFTEPYGVLSHPRVGLMWADFLGWSSGLIGDPEELVSAPIALQNGDTVGYELALPINVPVGHPFHPLDATGLSADFKFASYLLVVYDDVGTVPGQMDADDILAAVDLALPTVSWFQGTAPQSWANARYGYNMMELPEETGDPAVFLWDDWADDMDLVVDMAEIPTAELGGNIQFGTDLPAGSTLRLDLVLVDPAVIQGGGNVWDPANHSVLSSQNVAFVSGATVPFSIPLGDLTQDSHFDSWAMSLAADVLLNWAFPMLYLDVNQNGRWDPGSEPLYTIDQPFGIDQLNLWYVHRGVDWMFNLMVGKLHPGYVLVRSPLEYGVEQIFPATGRLQLSGNIEPGHTSVSFKVVREIGGEDVVVLSGTDLSTGTVESNEVWTLGDVTQVQLGDRLIITEVTDGMEFLPFDTSLRSRPTERRVPGADVQKVGPYSRSLVAPGPREGRDVFPGHHLVGELTAEAGLHLRKALRSEARGVKTCGVAGLRARVRFGGFVWREPAVQEGGGDAALLSGTLQGDRDLGEARGANRGIQVRGVPGQARHGRIAVQGLLGVPDGLGQGWVLPGPVHQGMEPLAEPGNGLKQAGAAAREEQAVDHAEERGPPRGEGLSAGRREEGAAQHGVEPELGLARVREEPGHREKRALEHLEALQLGQPTRGLAQGEGLLGGGRVGPDPALGRLAERLPGEEPGGRVEVEHQVMAREGDHLEHAISQVAESTARGRNGAREPGVPGAGGRAGGEDLGRGRGGLHHGRELRLAAAGHLVADVAARSPGLPARRTPFPAGTRAGTAAPPSGRGRRGGRDSRPRGRSPPCRGWRP